MQQIRNSWPALGAITLVVVTAIALFVFNGANATNAPIPVVDELPPDMPTPEPPPNAKELAWEALEEVLTQVPIEERAIPVTPVWEGGSFYIDGKLYSIPDNLVVRDYLIGGLCIPDGRACPRHPHYVFGPTNEGAPFDLVIEEETGKVWPNRSLSIEQQSAILEKHAPFIATLPGPIVEPAPPDWLPIDPVNKPTNTPEPNKASIDVIEQE